jgi:macrolide transport system ATP-binding/permease protein
MDLRHAWRSIRKMPVLSAVVVVSLGIGIGVNTAVFSWIQAVVLRPLPGVPDTGRLYLIEPRAETGSYPGISWLEYGDLRERLRSMPELLAFRMSPFTLGESGRAERIVGLLVSGNYFPALHMRPALGRFIEPAEVARPGGELVAVISYDFWRARFGRQVTALGQTIRVNERQLTIVGVAPERFQGTVLGLTFDLWVPATLAPALQGGSRELEDRTMRGYQVMGRVPSGTPVAHVQAELDQAMRDLAHAYPETNATLQAEVLPFWQAPRGPQRMLATSLAILQGILLILLLAVCGNTANLVLARASTRHREMGVRMALGAGRGRVVSLILAENILLGLLGAALGAVIAVWATEALRAVPILGAFPIKFQTHIDGASVAFAIVLGIACGLMFGLAPALQLSRVEPQTAFRSGAAAAGRSRLRNALMALEVGLALVVLLAAAMFYRSFSSTRDADPGFTREGVLLAAYDFTERNTGAPAARDFAARLLERLRVVPGVEAAAIATNVPLDIHGLPLRSFTLEGRARSAATPDRALTNTVTPGYLKAMGIPLVAGSDFVDLRDTATPPQAIVNEAFVRRFLDGAAPIGRRLESRGTGYAIAGVARNSVSESFGEPPIPVIYLSYRDRPSARGEIHLRTRPGAEPLFSSEVERIVRELDPLLPVYDVRTLNEHVEKNLFLRRIPARMFVVLGPLLLVLAAIGIYAVVSYAVARRTTEIGVRLALGATAGRVVSQIVGETLRVVGVGAIAAWLIAFVIVVHLVREPIDPAVFVGVPLALILVAAFASWLPARRATGVDVMVALRRE